MKKTLLLAMAVGVAAGVGGKLALRGSASPTRADSAVVAPVDLVSANGTVEGARPEIAVRPEVAGIITAVRARENDTVAAGQVVVELSNDAQKAQVALARAELAGARAQLKKLKIGERTQRLAQARSEVKARAETLRLARADYERMANSHGGYSAGDLDNVRSRYSVAQTELDKAKSELAMLEEGTRAEDVEAAEAQVQVAEAKLRGAEAELAKTRLTVPSGGQVLQVFAEPGELAAPNSAQPILIVADLSRRRVRAFVEELDVARVDKGAAATVSADGLPGKTFTGKVAVVLPRMGKRAPQSDAPNELKDLYYREVLIDLDAGDELPTNLRVQVRIESHAQR